MLRFQEWARVGAEVRLAHVKTRDMLWRLKRDGWQVVRQRGSHRQLAHPWKVGVVTVAGSASDDLHPETAASILKQAGLWHEESR